MMPTSIEILDVSFNKFTGGIPSEWGSLTNLKSLAMYSCGIGGTCVCQDVPSYRHPTPNLKQIACTGELPLSVIRMKAKGCDVKLNGNDPGFTLPSNIGELGDDITTLRLSSCSLRGAALPIIPPPHGSRS